MADIADNPSQSDVRDILSKHVSESTQIIIKNYAAVAVVRVRERVHLPPNRVSKRTRELESRKVRPPPRL